MKKKYGYKKGDTNAKTPALQVTEWPVTGKRQNLRKRKDLSLPLDGEGSIIEGETENVGETAEGTGEETAEERLAADLAWLSRLRPIDDDFMRCLFRDNPKLLQEVLRIVEAKPGIVVKKVETQRDVKFLDGSRSIVLDVYGADKKRIWYDVEVQRASSGAGRRRSRYHASALDVHHLKAGQNFNKLPETKVIFITEEDVLKAGLPVYHVGRVCFETGIPWKDGSNIIYVNGENREDTELGHLMADFHNPDPNTMYNPVLKRTVQYFKETEEGVRKMCQVFEEIREAGRKEGERRMSALVRQKDKEIEHKDKELKLQAKEFRLMQEHKDKELEHKNKELEHKDKELVLKEEQLRLRDEEIKWMKVNIGETVAKDLLNDGSRDISFISRISKLPEAAVCALAQSLGIALS